MKAPQPTLVDLNLKRQLNDLGLVLRWGINNWAGKGTEMENQLIDLEWNVTAAEGCAGSHNPQQRQAKPAHQQSSS